MNLSVPKPKGADQCWSWRSQSNGASKLMETTNLWDLQGWEPWDGSHHVEGSCGDGFIKQAKGTPKQAKRSCTTKATLSIWQAPHTAGQSNKQQSKWLRSCWAGMLRLLSQDDKKPLRWAVDPLSCLGGAKLGCWAAAEPRSHWARLPSHQDTNPREAAESQAPYWCGLSSFLCCNAIVVMMLLLWLLFMLLSAVT